MSAPARSVVLAIENVSLDRDPRARLIARTLRDEGYEVSVVCPRGGDAGLDGIGVRSFPTVGFDRLGFVGHLLEYAWCCSAIGVLLAWLRLAGRVDIVHVCVPPHVVFPLCRMLRLLGAAVVVDQHDLMPELFVLRYGRHRRLALRAVLASEGLALRSADAVLAANESGARVARERAGVDVRRVHVVRTAAGPVPTVQECRDPKSRPLLVGYVGNVDRQDGLDLLVRSAAHVRRELAPREVRFVCVGDGRDLLRTRRLARALAVDDAFDFLGRLGHAEALARLAGCDVCVQPDPGNPFNDSCTMLKSLEYMALAKPVVAFDLLETRLACGDAALYASPNDPVDLAAQIVTLLRDAGLRDRLGREGARRAAGPLSWRHGAAALLRAYAQLPARRPLRARLLSRRLPARLRRVRRPGAGRTPR